MFSITNTPDAIILESPTDKVEIWPSCGAILNSWQVQLYGHTYDVIDGYDSAEDFAKRCEEKGFRSCKLSPYVCRMNNATYEHNGQTYTIGKFMDNGNALHALLYNLPFTVVASQANDNQASVTLQYDYNNDSEGYPFPYQLQVTYTLQTGNRLSIGTAFKNMGNESIPVADGWHPYFKLGKKINELWLEINEENMVEFDERLIPTGELVSDGRFSEPALIGDTELDNCYRLRSPLLGAACRLVNEEEGIQLSILTDESYPYLQLYTPPHRNSIAIENISATPDAFNNGMGLLILDAGDTAHFTTHYIMSEV